ncbi:hypothetical protein WJX74_002822 [Apatococcus lobatus]|uniref:DUF962 domain-containing protein n=1 Tax=Apatococcus lobatus TaxID=904363 RepID=A0AAW1R449_9CHLO
MARSKALPTTYREFWPYYLQEHSAVNTRRLHYLGSTLSLCIFAVAAALGRPSLLAIGLLAGYGPAWVGHYFVECNRPATFKFPFWSLISDFRMWACWLLGTINTELAKASVSQPAVATLS